MLAEDMVTAAEAGHAHVKKKIPRKIFSYIFYFLLIDVLVKVMEWLNKEFQIEVTSTNEKLSL